jgi:hypothetical protein
LKNLKISLQLFAMVLLIVFSIFLINNALINNTPITYAVLTSDEADLCILLNTDFKTGIVDVIGMFHCMDILDND